MDLDLLTNMPAEAQDIRLVVEIKNKEPLELMELTKSFVSLANQFNSYASNFGDSKENRAAKLYVKEIKTGSVIMELIEFATVGVLPFVENMNTIVGFADYVKRAYNYILGKTKDKPKELTTTDYRDLAQIINPVANDSDAQFNISTKVDGNLELHFHIGTVEANAAQHLIDKTVKQLKSPEDGNETQRKVLLTFYQTRSDIKAKAGNKGIIESITDAPLNILFEDESLNEQMLHGEFNPHETVYVVDVLPQKVNGKIAAYKILKLHETFDKPEAD